MTKMPFAALAVLAVLSAPLAAQAPKPLDPAWLTWTPETNTATLQVIAGFDGTNGALNFDGFKDGELVFTVPEKSTVAMSFTNHDGMLPHSAVVLTKTTPLPNDGSGTPGIQRAYTNKAVEGIPPQGKDVARFTALPAGSYMIYCGVPGHGPSGMYITLVVSATAKTATMAYVPRSAGR
jgi:hypothetical protein